MTTLDDLAIDLAYLRIDVPAVIGYHRTTCPQCSHNRKKPLETCLVVRINEAGFTAHCHHCLWEVEG